MARPIVFLSDYGLDDEFVGVCHAVIARLEPDAKVIDLTHAIAPQDVLQGALVLQQSLPYLPADAVILAVVDPGVGTERRPIAVSVHDCDRLYVGPDNGVLSLGWGQAGPARAVEITAADVILQPSSRTFHGRDVFAPAAARLAKGSALEDLGPALDVGTLSRVDVPQPEVEGDEIHTEVLGVDRYGNVQLSVRREHVEGLVDSLEVVIRGEVSLVPRAETFGDVAEGRLAAILDSAGWVALVVNRGSAAEVLGLAPGHPITLRARTVG